MQFITTPATSLILALALPAFSQAYTWNFKSTPQQCSDLTVEVSGSGGSPPYRILIVPFGGTPFSNGSEVRTIFETPFDGDSTSVTFKLNYPADSQFVAVVSDAAGFGTGGTSVAAQVTSSDTTCFDASQKNEPDFYYSIDPLNQIVQCQDTRIYWTKGDPQGNPIFLGVIPGGQSFVIPQTDYTDEPSLGTGFKWNANLRSMTTFLLVGGDGRGNGTAGSTLYTVGGGSENNASCLGDNSPSSTAGDPAGGAYQTGSDGSGTGGDGNGSGGGSSGGDNGGTGSTSSSGPNIGAIVGGVVGGVAGVAAILLLLWFLRRKSKNEKKQKEKPVDLLNEDEGDERPARQELPQYYEPEPFLVPDPTVDGSSTNGDQRAYMSSRSETPDLMTPSTTSVGGGKRAPRQLRPVNIIQHDDAGPSDMGGQQEETETIELPPAYTKIRGDGTPGTPEPRDREIV